MRVRLLALICLASGTAVAASAESGKVYVSDDGVEVAVVTLKGSAKAIVRITGSGTELDGKARLHEVVQNGERLEYHGRGRGRDTFTLVARGGQYTVWVP